MYIRMSRKFLGPNSEQVEELYLVNAETLENVSEDVAASLNEPSSVFIGTTYISAISIDETGQQVQLPPQEISFPIKAKNRIESFNNFEKSAKDYIQYLKDQEEKHRLKNNLYVPNAAEVNDLNKLKIVN